MNSNDSIQKKIVDLVILPPTLEEALTIHHENEILLLDKEPKAYVSYDLPPAVYAGADEPYYTSLAPQSLASCSLPDVPSPRVNTFVLNIKKIEVDQEKVTLFTNYTTMRSQFALRRWVPALVEMEKERETKMNINFDAPITKIRTSDAILRYILPIGGAMILETADNQILIEERGKVEMPGKYNPAPAGGCETRNWRVRPELFRSIEGEAWEETSLLPERDYGAVSLIGMARDHTEGFNPAFAYHTKTHLPLQEVIQRAESIAPEAGEHQRLFGASAHPDKLLDFCIEHQMSMVGNGLGDLLAFGNYKFGDDWLKSSIKELEKKQWEIKLYKKTFP